MKEQDILTVQQFADAINVHYNTVRNMIKKGLLSAFKIGYGEKKMQAIAFQEAKSKGLLL